MKEYLARHMRAFLLALQFLTTLPVPGQRAGDSAVQGLSLLWYPAVGVLLGLLLGLLSTLFSTVFPLPLYLQAMLTVTLWIALTGGLHLDGVADCADAWVGGLGDREKTLRLLKDPLCGSMGVISLIVVIALKAAALAAVMQLDQLVWLWAVPLLARLSLLLLFLTTPYVRPQGLGEILAQQFPRTWAKSVLISTAIILLYFLPLALWCGLLLTSIAIFLLLRWAAMRRLGGFTGDLAGAQIELVEVGLLLVLASRSVV